MAHFDIAKVGSDGFAFQVGTLSGNPVASFAGMKTLEILRWDGVYDKLRAFGRRNMAALGCEAEKAGISRSVVGDPVLFDFIFAKGPIVGYRAMQSGDEAQSAAVDASLRKVAY